MIGWLRHGGLALLWVAAASAVAATPTVAPLAPQAPTVEQERSRIERERAAEMGRQQAVESACYQRFAVNDCLAEARVKHREVLSDLKRQEVQLNDRERRLRAGEQLRRIEEKVSSPERDIDLLNRQQQAQRTEQDRQLNAEKKAVDSVNQTQERAGRRQEQQRRLEQAQKEDAERAQKAQAAADERKRYDEKLRDAAQHRQQLQQDIKNRSGARAAPLPDPAGAPASKP
ncbi:hypothetical protein PSQ40_01500 [Curvibacter sp. HBC61]|uniref:DUF1090 domain-containing protein n=1 Tax=Curvibacter cyanobacteriorum TaxID=3026422 RepID=A0ABT5MT77_9BURK|nr:hypothetical protein [Curvibacter sp. HBC61]MDD0837235.1 hypothetical protein [Curvibacter sp. HBC61]